MGKTFEMSSGGAMSFRLPWLCLAVLLLRLQARGDLHDWIWPDAGVVPEAVFKALPSAAHTNGYAGSAACRACHESEHASWHKSYHRTMTQPALTNTVLGNFDGSVVESGGLQYRVFKEGDVFMAEMPDPDLMMYVVQGGKKAPPGGIPNVRRPVVMTTGSHHYQTYWVSSERLPGILQTLPLVYLRSERRWIPREDAFLRGPSDTNRFVIQWNHHCIRCHSTAGNPGLEETSGRLQTRVAELGISCEACHGPGEKHAAKWKDRPRQTLAQSVAEADSTIVNPSLLDHRRSSEVCGQCHGAYIMKPEFAMAFAREGAPYRPGDELFKTRYELKHPRVDPTPSRVADYRNNRSFFREQWWDDGTVLAGGREFTALSASKCYTKGTVSCVTCHTMHKGEPDDQLKAGADTPSTCVKCHTASKYTTELEKHTHHKVGAEGSNCLNCHMPYNTYALFKGIRSHQIESPDNTRISRFGTPNACNLCHLDKTLAWTRDNLFVWYGQKRHALKNEQETTSAALLWLLKGDAAQRVVTAWNAGWAPALQASGTNWIAPFQAQLLADSYGAVRHVAGERLRVLPGFEKFEYDFMAPDAARRQRVTNALERWIATVAKPQRTGEAVLIDNAGKLQETRIADLIRDRDNRSITIQE